MKRRLKKLAVFGLAAVMTTGMLAGCGSGQADSEKTDSKEADKSAKNETTLEVEVIYTGQPLDQFRKFWTDSQKRQELELNWLHRVQIMRLL